MTEAMEQRWRATTYPALHWEALDLQRVCCGLCPRRCVTKPGQSGFCGVRRNEQGSLVTLNYGKSVPMTQESIETEAVFHYAPGEAILSLGNLGCMMRCDFCQNWTTSQAALVRDADLAAYTPEQVVDYALRHGIRVLSWTYNDPVVWHEFVLETARLAQSKGLKNLYKSAFYISERAIDDLLGVMDIFSLSLKSMDAEFYRNVTKGELADVLKGILQVYAARKNSSGPHLEISNLCVTGRNDTLEHSQAVADWMLRHLDADIPLHYVRFHPDYLYRDVPRTSVSFLEQARVQALQAGLRYVYVGNVHGTPSAHTYCPGCGRTVVRRSGLAGTPDLGGTDGCSCPDCGRHIPVILPWRNAARTAPVSIPQGFETIEHVFRGPIRSCHVEQNPHPGEHELYFMFTAADGQQVGETRSSTCARFMISCGAPEARSVRLYHRPGARPKLYEVYDRAHFPVQEAYLTLYADQDLPPAERGPHAPC